MQDTKNEKIDVGFDFTADTPRFWDNCWSSDPILGTFNNDPDSASKMLQLYHKLLWSKRLPNGEFMNLSKGSGTSYLTWNNMRFGSDSITASFRYKNNRKMIKSVSEAVPNYKGYIESYIRKTYTIGGSIIFPKHAGGINQSRGINPYIKDRWDLTLECIRLYYEAKHSPLYEALNSDKAFFDLFVDFRGYVDYFFLQDCVSTDYSAVKFWLGNGTFEKNPLPKTVDEYFYWMKNQLEFVSNRNKRIEDGC